MGTGRRRGGPGQAPHVAKLRRVALGPILLSGAAVLAVASGADADLEPAPLDEYVRSVDERLPAQMERYDVPGAAAAVVVDGEVAWSAGYGVTDEGTQEPVTTETVWQAGSISKSLTAWSVLRLAEDDAIDLGAPAQEYLARWELPSDSFGPDGVTVERVLSHTAGLPWQIGESRPPERSLSAPELLSGAQGGEPVRVVEPPGTAFRYSNPGYTLLELLVEDVTGGDFATVVEAEVLEPLGMDDSAFAWRDEFAPRATTGYTFDGEPVEAQRQPPAAAGGLYTTVDDLARFVAASTSGGQGQPPGRGVLQPASVEAMQRPVAPVEGMPHALMAEATGLGHFVEDLPDGRRAVMHGGENEGALGGFFAVPETGDGVVLLTNSRRSYRLMADHVAAWAEWRGLGAPAVTRTFDRAQTVLWLTLALGAAAAWIAWRLVQGLRCGARRWAPVSREAGAARLAQVGLGVLLLILWWGPLSGILPTFFPVLSGYVAAVLSGLGGLLLLTAATVPTASARPAPSQPLGG